MKLSEKIKALRLAEKLNQAKFCEVVGLSLSTLTKYETGRFEPGGNILVKLASHPRFEKYTMWLMTDKTAPEVGQISPLDLYNVESEIKPKEFIGSKDDDEHNTQAIINNIKNLKSGELHHLNKMLSRKGPMFLLNMLDEENQDLVELRGLRRFIARRLKNSSDRTVREILDRINQDGEKDDQGFAETMQKVN